MSQIKDLIIAIDDFEHKLLVERKRLRNIELALDADRKRLRELIISEGYAGCMIQVDNNGESKIYSIDDTGEIHSIERVVKL
jgi:hypothetical protein